MNLCYRGIRYEHPSSSLEFTEGETGGRYRGAAWRSRRLKTPLIPDAIVTLTYRGINYLAASSGLSTKPVDTSPAHPERLTF